MIRAPADLFARWSRLRTLAAYGHAPHFLAAVNAVSYPFQCGMFNLQAHHPRKHERASCQNYSGTAQWSRAQAAQTRSFGVVSWQPFMATIHGNHSWQPPCFIRASYTIKQVFISSTWRQNMSLIEKLDQVLGISLWSLRYAEINGLFV